MKRYKHPMLSDLCNIPKTSAIIKPLEIKERHEFAAGDLVELFSTSPLLSFEHVISGNCKSRLAIIHRIDQSDSGGKSAVVGVSRENKLRWISTSNISFHYPRYVQVDKSTSISTLLYSLKQFSEQVKHRYKSILSSVKSIVAKYQQRPRLDRLMYYDDLVDEVFGQNVELTAPESYMLYKAMRQSHLIKDCHMSSMQVYHPLSKRLSSALDIMKKSAGSFDQLKHNLYEAALRKGKFPQSHVDEAALVLLEHCALYPEYLQTHDGIIKIVKDILEGIWPYSTQRDLILLLCNINNFPSHSGIPLRQSVLYESSCDLRGEQCKPFKVELTGGIPKTLLVQTGELFAIDSPNTIDVDDAICLTSDTLNGSYWLHVHISDPSRFFEPNSPIDLYARSKVSSVYLPERHIPMLPKYIASMACLDPASTSNETIVFSVKLGEGGDIVDYAVNQCRSVKLRRVTYEECDSMLCNPNHPKHCTLWKMYTLALQHRQFRKSNGASDFFVAKPTVAVSREGSVITIAMPDARETPSQILVSECMVMAGRVASFLATHYNIPVPFRYHPGLDPGLKFPDTFEGRLQLMETMKPTAVDLRPRRHSLMGVGSYVKVTSPLRRYLDLLAHHQLRAAFVTKKPLPYSANNLMDIVPRLFRHEQYIKRLEQASRKFWLLVHLQRSLQSNGSLECDAVCTGKSVYFLYMYNTAFNIRTISEPPPNTPVKLRLRSADPFRMNIDGQIIK